MQGSYSAIVTVLVGEVIIGGVFAAATFAATTSRPLVAADTQRTSYDYYADSQTAPPTPTDSTAAPSETTASSGCPSRANCGCDGCQCTCTDVPPCRWFDNCCCLKECDTTLTGWIDGGIMGNADSPHNHFNGPVTFPDRDNGQLNQFYGILQRTPTDILTNCGWFLGGDVDLFYGSDYFFTTAAGLDGTKRGNVPRWNTDPGENYGFSMPQLYAETDYDNLRIKWGHFYSILGYEVVPAIGNFFYTHSYAMQYGEPRTHTGMLASSNLNDNWSWSAGLVGGWNDFALQEGAQFLGGLTYSVKNCGSIAFSLVTGNESDFNVPDVKPESNRTMYSLVWTSDLSSRLTYVLQHDFGVQENTQGFNASNSTQADWYGINQYLFYKLNCCWTLGWRFEWFDDPEGYLVTGLRPGNTDALFRFPGSFYETSLGLNYKPNSNLTIRPELRFDWYTGPPGFISPAVPGNPPNEPFNDNLDKNQFLLGLDAIYQF